jgi:N-acetylmuramoyl-L-alanine amidase-like protein/putative peptidoglycan binding protein
MGHPGAESGRRPVRRSILKAGLGAAAASVVGGQLTASPALAVPSAEFPWIIDCDSWAARPPAADVSLSGTATNKIMWHHMAFPNVTDYSREQAVKLAQDCQNLHMDGNGWVDTGQHFTVSRGGYVLEGRHRSLEQLSGGKPQVIAAHCPGENGRAIGIENEGTYVDETPPVALLKSLTRLSVAICREYGLKAHDIFGHWDARDTLCPGAAFYAQFPMVRRWVRKALGTRLSAIPRRRWPDTWRFVGGPVVRVAQYLLNGQGYTLAVDGAFGTATVAAVQDWQAKNGLPVDVDATLTAPTWETLAPDLRLGATGPAVNALQLMLTRKGFLATASAAFDDATVQAVKGLQRLHGLDRTGKVDKATWCAAVGGIVRESFED